MIAKMLIKVLGKLFLSITEHGGVTVFLRNIHDIIQCGEHGKFRKLRNPSHQHKADIARAVLHLGIKS